MGWHLGEEGEYVSEGVLSDFHENGALEPRRFEPASLLAAASRTGTTSDQLYRQSVWSLECSPPRSARRRCAPSGFRKQQAIRSPLAGNLYPRWFAIAEGRTPCGDEPLRDG